MTCHQSSSATRSFELSSRNNSANFSQSLGSLGMLERAVASFGDCTEDNSSGLRNLSLPETHVCLAASKGSKSSCCLQPELSAHAAAMGLHCADTSPTPAAFLCLPMPQPRSAGLTFTLASHVFPHRQGWDLFLTGDGKQTGFCFKPDNIL